MYGKRELETIATKSIQVMLVMFIEELIKAKLNQISFDYDQ